MFGLKYIPKHIIREMRIDKVRLATAKRRSIKQQIAKQHGVSPRRIVLQDADKNYIGRNSKGRYVIKTKVGPNLKFNF